MFRSHYAPRLERDRPHTLRTHMAMGGGAKEANSFDSSDDIQTAHTAHSTSIYTEEQGTRDVVYVCSRCGWRVRDENCSYQAEHEDHIVKLWVSCVCVSPFSSHCDYGFQLLSNSIPTSGAAHELLQAVCAPSLQCRSISVTPRGSNSTQDRRQKLLIAV